MEKTLVIYGSRNLTPMQIKKFQNSLNLLTLIYISEIRIELPKIWFLMSRSLTFNNICMEKGYYRGVTFSDNWSFWWWVGALVCTNHHYQVSRALGLIICTPEYKMLVQNGQKRHFQPTPNILFAHIFLDFFLLKS